MAIKNTNKDANDVDFPIGRITLVSKGSKLYDTEKNLVPLFADFVTKVPISTHIGIIITPAAFLKFKIPSAALLDLKVDAISEAQLQSILDLATEQISQFFVKVGSHVLKKMVTIADFMSIGIDGNGKAGRFNRVIELVAIYDLKDKKVIHWTGKFYPVANQVRNLIRFPRLDSHFISLNGHKVMVLGCHDLNVFHPRGKDKITDWRRDAFVEFTSLSKKFKPEIVIQHPHITIDHRTWINGWKGMEGALLSVKQYASGIRTKNSDYLFDCYVDDILRLTKKGNVFEYSYKV